MICPPFQRCLMYHRPFQRSLPNNTFIPVESLISKLVPGGDKDTDIRSSHIVLYDDDVDYLLYADKRPNIWMQKQALELPGAIRMRDERSNMNKQAPKASNRRAVFEMPDDQVLQNSSFRVNMRDWRKGGNYHLCCNHICSCDLSASVVGPEQHTRRTQVPR